MNADEIRRAVHAALRRIAPEIDPAVLRGGEDLRQQADIDSVDFLNFIVAVHDSLGVDVPESDYPKLQTLDGCVHYLQERLASVPMNAGKGST